MDDEIERLRREVERTSSTVLVAVAAAVGIGIAIPVMFVVAVPEIMRPQWLADAEVLIAFWSAAFLFATAAAYVVVVLLRRRSPRTP